MTKQEYLDFFNGEIAYRFNSSEDAQSFLNELVRWDTFYNGSPFLFKGFSNTLHRIIFSDSRPLYNHEKSYLMFMSEEKIPIKIYNHNPYIIDLI